MAIGTRTDASFLEAALVGFEQMRRNIEEKIAAIRRTLGGDGAGAAGSVARRRHPLSVAARRRIAAAQRKRWAAFKKAKAQKSAPKAKGRKAAA